MSKLSIVILFSGVVFLAVLSIAPQSQADSVLFDGELSSDIAKHHAIDSAQIRAIRLSGYFLGWVTAKSAATFSMTDAEIQNVADFSADRLRAKYPQIITIHIGVSGEREGLLHTISFKGRTTGSVVRGEVTYSDPRCRSEVFFNSQFTG